ncbi:hypothetical protein CK203_034189 [Vitis vinifera]|uniref:Putative plant transposon protein domain-containing protein n=1 Tax=Vitis vinifera TaxID=29760 RepID=A0A438IEW4_VITVI|nr:hypothetical protein CK203_034189 [Vitis vinifera]
MDSHRQYILQHLWGGDGLEVCAKGEHGAPFYCRVSWRLGETGVPRRHWASVLLRLLRTVRQRLAERRGSTPAFSLRPTNTRGTSSISFRGRAFYSRVTYGHGGLITSTVRGVQIHLDPESICRILDIPPGGLRVYDAKAWPTVPGFDLRKAIQRMCGLANAPGLGKPSAHSLTVTCRVLHHMIAYILLPHGGHRDEVSYLEAFLIDSIMTGRRIDVGYVMMMHMMACCERPKRILPYGRFMTRVFKDAGVDLSREQEVEAPSSYDTYDEQSMARMKLEKAPDGS